MLEFNKILHDSKIDMVKRKIVVNAALEFKEKFVKHELIQKRVENIYIKQTHRFTLHQQTY